MKLTHLTAIALVASTASIAMPAFADDLDSVRNLSQAEFGLLARDLTAAGSYKAVSPAEPLGIVGFDIGAEASATKMDNSDLWRKAGGDSSTVYMPRVHVHKGLPFGFDIGASLTMVPGSDIKLIGAELKYAIVSGNVALPAVAIRAAATRLTGVDQLDMDTRSLELTVSKGFLNVTPYAGVGRVWGDVTPNVANLREVSTSANKVYAGVNFNLGIANLAAEIDRTGSNQTASIKLGFRL